MSPEKAPLQDYPGAGTVAEFCAHLANERRLSPNTLRNYEEALRDFARWAENACGFRGDFASISRRDVRDFVIERGRGNAPLSRRTLHNHVSALRTFFLWLRRKGRLAASPLTGIVLPKLPKTLPKFLTEQQAAELLAMPQQAFEEGLVDEAQCLRDRAALETLYGGGLRVGELCGLTAEAIDFSAGTARVPASWIHLLCPKNLNFQKMTRRKIVGISLPPELEAAVKAHIAELGIGMTAWVRSLITAELRRAGFDVAPLISRLGEGRGKRNDLNDERRARMIERFSAERALPAPHAAELLRAVEAEEEAQQRPMSARRFRCVAALVLAELAARENDAASGRA